MDAGGVEQTLDSGAAQQVLGAQVLRQVDEHLAARDLVTMDVTDELHLWLHCGGGEHSDLGVASGVPET